MLKAVKLSSHFESFFIRCFHMANKIDAPWLAEAFFKDFKQLYPEVKTANINLPSNKTNRLNIFD